MSPFLKAVTSVSLLLLAVTVQRAQAQELFLFGHFEVQVDYDLSPGNPDDGWNFSISYDDDNDFNDRDGITRNDPDDLILFAAPNTQFAIPGSLPRFGTEGDPFWILPQSNILGTLFLGQRTVADQGLFQTSVDGAFRPSSLGNIVLEMTEVSGSGPDNGGLFAVWESRQLGSLEFHFDSTDGVDDNDRLEPVQIGGHTHYNWGMTQPGTYEVTYKASGRLNPQHGNHDTSAEQTYTYAVPYSNTASSGAELRVGLSPNKTRAAIFNADESVEYHPGQVALLTSPSSQSGAPLPYTYLLNIATDKTAAPNRIGVEPAEAITFSGGLAPAGKLYELLETIGPGVLTIFNEENNSALLSFSEPGIYRLRLRVVGRQIADDTLVNGEPFTLTVLAGINPDYNYTSWAESFEKAHGLVATALDDVDADYDEDGLANRIEFLLFWHGFDPVVADGHLLPTSNSPDAPASFFMDSYKDDFSSQVADSTPRYSNIWITQDNRSRTGVFTLGQQPGNAYGRLLYVARLKEDLLPQDRLRNAQVANYFLTEALPNDTGWISLEDSLGWTNISYFPWLYHLNLGWSYASGNGIENAWLWDTQLKWLWTTGSAFPWFWSHERKSWIYYLNESRGPRWFYDASSRTWLNL